MALAIVYKCVLSVKRIETINSLRQKFYVLYELVGSKRGKGRDGEKEGVREWKITAAYATIFTSYIFKYSRHVYLHTFKWNTIPKEKKKEYGKVK